MKPYAFNNVHALMAGTSKPASARSITRPRRPAASPGAGIVDRIVFAPYEPRDPDGATAPAAVLIRYAAPADAAPVAALMAARDGTEGDVHHEKLAAEFLRPDLGDKRLLLVAHHGDDVVGFARALYCVPEADAPPNVAPQGWYLGGVVVAAGHRRRGIGRELTRRRLAWLVARGARAAWFVVNADNRASIDLHAPFGFREVTRDFVQKGVTFSGRGIGILYRADLDAAAGGIAPP